MLTEFELETRGDQRAISAEDAVRRHTAVGEPDRHVSAPLKSLSVREIIGTGVLRQCGRTAKRIAGEDSRVVLLQRTRNHWVEARYRRPQAEGRADQAVGACTDATGSRSSAARTGTDGSAEPAYATARRILHYAEICSEEVVGSGLRAQNICIGNIQVITRDTDVKIVLQRQGNCVVDRKHNLAVTHELLDPRRIDEIRRRHMLRHIWLSYVRKRRS